MTAKGASAISQVKCKIVFAVILFIVSVCLSAHWINWNAAIVFYHPSLDTGGVAATTVSEERLATQRWIEKRDFMEEVFRETCENNSDFHILTNFNFRVLGTRVDDSVAYFCGSKQLYVNLKIKPATSKTRLECTETYAGHTIVRTDRYHPVSYSYVQDQQEENHTSVSYEQTCMLYQTGDLLSGKWKP